MANVKAINNKSTFSTECTVTVNINAGAETIWDILTNGHDITTWNSTIISFEGTIALNQTVTLQSTAAPERTFNLKVTRLDKPTMMVWEDGMAPMFKGVRTYTLTAKSDNTTDFTMHEAIRGLMLPLIGGSLPDFRPTFEQFAKDLKQRAES